MSSSNEPEGRVRSARAGSAKHVETNGQRVNSGRERSPPSQNTHGSVINDRILNRFIEIQAQIENYERIGVFDKLRLAEEDFERLEKSKRQAEINHKVLEEQTKKEKQDFENISQPTVQSFFKDKQAHNIAISKEQQEYLNSLNALEIAANELKAITGQYENAKEKLAKYKQENQRAIELYNEQMSILYSTFEGDYGSDLENQLEKEVKVLAEYKDQLKLALHKWSNARFLLVYAYNQIQYAEQKWAEMMKLEMNNPEKVIFATEVRNNLVAANQNLCNTRTYLKNIELPYCTEEDLKALQGLSAGVYQDMLTVQRERYAIDIIRTLRMRCAALNQWFDQVIKDSLVVDYSKVRLDYDEKFKLLKMERIRLLQEKIKEKTGKDVKINLMDDKNQDHKDPLESISFINQPFKAGGAENSSKDITEKPISSYDLPPPPSRKELLGSIEQIQKQYWQQVNEWNRHMDEGRREADQRLKEALKQNKM